MKRRSPPSPTQLLVASLLGTTALLASGCVTRQSVVTTAAPLDVPHTFVWRPSNLFVARARLRAGDPAMRAAYDALLRDANATLKLPALSVTQKKRIPPSGDPHDYMSFGPYWWPDTTKPNGLPFIRRDGVVNPESRFDADSPRLLKLTDMVEQLSLAWWFSGDTTYAGRAATLIRTWFLDPATRMNPNLRFAQAIPGVTEGRGIGIIDTRHMSTIIDAIGLLQSSREWTAADQQGMLDWTRQYLAWLATSVQGKEEREAENNHGTWYDAQVASMALFVGDTALARYTIAESAPKRLAKQVAPDGSQPEELARTRPLHYSLFNVEPFSRLAEMSRFVGTDFWGWQAPNGASLPKAAAFIAPWVDRNKVWPTPQATPLIPEEFLGTLRRAASRTHDAVIVAAIRTIPDSARREDRSALLYPDAERPRATATALDSLFARTMAHAKAQLRRTADSLDPAQGWPRSTRPDGTWERTPATSWTAGFFPGSLWQMYAVTSDPYWRRAAQRWTAGLEVNATRTNTHDLGFLVFDSFGLQHLLTGDAHAREVVLQASRSLATRFDPKVGAIKSWDTFGGADARGSWEYPVIIDNMMNLEMLFWAAANGGDPAWKALAERHALTSARAHLRPDGSTAHVALFDPRTGALLRRVTWQGAADSSTWARGQAWAIYGYGVAYASTGRPELLAAARQAADWFIAHLPPDGVPWWDFRDPAIPNAPRDASAAAIAAAGLLRLGPLWPAEDAPRYRRAADRMLEALCRDFVTRPNESWAILAHSTGGKPQGTEVDVGLAYADYYLLEALRLRAAGSGKPDV